MRELLVARATVDMADENGRTPLLVASRNGHSRIVKVLLATGANFDQTDDNGLSPFCAAVDEGRLEVVRQLLLAGAKSGGSRALSIARRKGHTEIENLLIKHGFDY